MTYLTRHDTVRSAGSGPLLRPPGHEERAPGAVSGSPDGGDTGALGQAIVVRLFGAGLALNSALGRIRDGPATDRVRYAVEEIDGAIGELRHLMLTLPGLATGASRTGSAARPGSPDSA